MAVRRTSSGFVGVPSNRSGLRSSNSRRQRWSGVPRSRYCAVRSPRHQSVADVAICVFTGW
eukprot:4712584-Prymnesium_polylepis.1